MIQSLQYHGDQMCLTETIEIWHTGTINVNYYPNYRDCEGKHGGAVIIRNAKWHHFTNKLYLLIEKLGKLGFVVVLSISNYISYSNFDMLIWAVCSGLAFLWLFEITFQRRIVGVTYKYMQEIIKPNNLPLKLLISLNYDNHLDNSTVRKKGVYQNLGQPKVHIRFRTCGAENRNNWFDIFLEIQNNTLVIYDQSTTSRLGSNEFKYVKQEAQCDRWCSWLLYLSMFQLVYVWHP